MSAANYHQFFHGSIGCWSGQDTGHTIYVKVPLEKNGCNLGLCATLMSRVLNCFHWWSQVYACIISYPKWICQAYFHNISVCPKRATPFAGVWGPKKKRKMMLDFCQDGSGQHWVYRKQRKSQSFIMLSENGRDHLQEPCLIACPPLSIMWAPTLDHHDISLPRYARLINHPKTGLSPRRWITLRGKM